MTAKRINSQEEYTATLENLETMMDAAPRTSEEEELGRLAILVEEYEREYYPIAPPDPVDAILFRMYQYCLTHTQ